jgi:hypothetical protein
MLVAIPCQLIVRRRHDCSAPAVTSFGIVTGVAIMLISFGPSVLFLYKKPRNLCDSVSNLAPKQKRRSHPREAPFSTSIIRAD